MKKMMIVSAMLAVLMVVSAANAVQYNYLDPGYNQQIFIGPLPAGASAGMVWTSGGNLLIKSGTNILEYSLGTTVYNGTNVHPVAVTHAIPGLYSGPNSGVGMTKGLDGNIYILTNSGLQRFSVALTGSATVVAGTIPSNGYGITTLPDGRIAYTAGINNSEVWLYDPSTNLNTATPIYTTPGNALIDDIEASATGEIALALQMAPAVTIISNTGAFINSITGLAHNPDGLAFGDGVMANWLYSNNNDGSITRYVLGSGFSGTAVVTDIALQTTAAGKAYGDLASVGPDCAFYVTQFNNFGYNGSTWGVGTHWDDTTTTADASIVRIAMVDPRTGAEMCGFGTSIPNTPEPSSILALGTGLFGLLGLLKRKK